MAVPVPQGPEFGRTRRTRRTLVLAVVFVLYLVLGGVAFRYLETYQKTVTVLRPGVDWRPLIEYLDSNTTEERPSTSWTDLKRAAVARCDQQSRQQVGVLLESFRIPAEEEEEEKAEEGKEEVLTSLRVPAEKGALDEVLLLCGNNSYELLPEEREVPWSFIDSVFFCMTVVTTIGYGHISPKTPGGQIFCIVYSLLGIPTSGLLLAGLSDFFAGNLLNFYDSKWRQRHGDSRWSLAAFTVLYLMVGFLMFVFVPAIVFTWLEDWNYREAVYYAFITLSTIGFGDYTAAVSDDTPWTSVYKVFVMVWILVGLGYWVLVLNFLQKTLKSKEVLKTLKSTSRLIAKEADELRSVLAEVGLIHRDAVFIPEHSKMALSMMLNMSSSLAGTSQSGSPGDPAAPAGLRGIHSIGDNMRSHGLLAALLSSLPPPSPPAAVGPPTDQQGLVNEGYLSDGTPERAVPSEDAPDTGRRPQEDGGDEGLQMTVGPVTGAQQAADEERSVSAPSAGCDPSCAV